MTAVRALAPPPRRTAPSRPPRPSRPSRPSRPVLREAPSRSSRAARPVRLAPATAARRPVPAAGWVRTFVLLAVVVIGALAVAVFIQGQRISTQERHDAVRAELARAHELNRDLRVAVAQAESPEVVLDAARDLGMIEPAPVVAVPPGPVPGSAAAGVTTSARTAP